MSKKFRLFFWLSRAFLKKHKKTLVITFVLGIIAFGLIVKVLPNISLPTPTERIGLIGKYSTDDLPDRILKKLSQGLTVVAQDGSAASGLAEKWEVSGDGTIYTFFLRDDLFWQDDNRFSASDINFNFSDVDQEVLDHKRIKFVLKEPFTPFPIILSKPVFKEELLGVGPFKATKVKKKANTVESIKLAGPEKNIVYKFYPTLETAKQAFKIGEIDILEGLFVNPFSGNWQEFVEEEKEVKKDQYVAVFLNNKDEFLSEKTARQALAYATSKENGETRALTPLNLDSWAYSEDVKKYDFSPDKARELLGKNKEEAAEIRITLSTTQPFLGQAEKIKKDWEEVLGITVDILVINTIPEDFQALLTAQEIPADPDQYPLWHSTQSQNFIGYKSPRVDKILEDGRKERDLIKRKELYADFQKFLLEDCPVIFLYHPIVYTIRR